MLILTRRIGETIFVGDDVRITVLGIKGNQASIGIAAPTELPIHREEIYKRILAERAAALAIVSPETAPEDQPPCST